MIDFDFALESVLVPYYESPFWGVLVSGWLFGIVVAQAWRYFTTNRDGWNFRSMVATTVLFDFVALGLQAEYLHHYLLKNYGDPSVLEVITTSGPVSMAISYTTVFIVEIFFATRVYLLTKRIWITGCIFLIAVLSLGCGFVTVFMPLQDPRVASLGDFRTKIGAGVYCALSLLSAGIITITLTRQLHAGSNIGIKSTRAVLQRLLLFIATRGIIICMLHLISLILFVIFSDKLVWVASLIASSRIYIITMLAILNHRKEMRDKLGEVVTDDQFTSVINGIPSYPDSIPCSSCAQHASAKSWPSMRGITVSTSIIESV